MTAVTVESSGAALVDATGTTRVPFGEGVESPDPHNPSVSARYEGLGTLGAANRSVYHPGSVWAFGRALVQVDIEVAAAGDYDVTLNCCVSGGSVEVSISAGGSSVKATAKECDGFFAHERLNFQRLSFPTPLRLEAGTTVVQVQTVNKLWSGALLLQSLELTPTVARDAIATDQARAQAARAAIDTMRDERYGLMLCWAEASAPQAGPVKPFEQAVAELDVEKLADMVVDTGAGYVIWTFQHASPCCPAPIPEWEAAHPGTTTTRDLIADLAQALSARGVSLHLYFASHIFAKRGLVPKEEFVALHTGLLRAVGERYGEKVQGFWLDGFYQNDYTYPGLPYEQIYQACKAGNSARMVTLNSWVYPTVTDWQDYWAGEASGPGPVPTTQIVEAGPGAGLPFQALFGLEPVWLHEEIDTPIPAPLLTGEELAQFIEECTGIGPVTVNLGIYQDGSISPASLAVMREVRCHIRGT